ncbi:MAG: hypothetical protein J6M61_07985 [Bacteroidales bacterium]|jgi:hypothetical protein|nr:hypothetical protein [Bacteroidales bacterium]
MSTVYCVKHIWLDKDGEKIPSMCATHSWHTSYKKAEKEYEKRLETLYSNYPSRTVERVSPNIGYCPDDGTYELSSAIITADGSGFRVCLSAVTLQ